MDETMGKQPNWKPNDNGVQGSASESGNPAEKGRGWVRWWRGWHKKSDQPTGQALHFRGGGVGLKTCSHFHVAIFWLNIYSQCMKPF